MFPKIFVFGCVSTIQNIFIYTLSTILHILHYLHWTTLFFFIFFSSNFFFGKQHRCLSWYWFECHGNRFSYYLWTIKNSLIYRSCCSWRRCSNCNGIVVDGYTKGRSHWRDAAICKRYSFDDWFLFWYYIFFTSISQ